MKNSNQGPFMQNSGPFCQNSEKNSSIRFLSIGKYFTVQTNQLCFLNVAFKIIENRIFFLSVNVK